MKKTTLYLITIIFMSCSYNQVDEKVVIDKKIDSLFPKNIEHGLICKGDNFPDFIPQNDSVDYFLFSLHENIPLTDFKQRTNFSDKKLDEIEKLLKSKNWLHDIGNTTKPSIFIATQKDGEILYEYALPLANSIVNEIEKELPSIKTRFKETAISKNQSFEEWSFLSLSNVLLDSWQIDDVEKEYLKKENRPQRHGKNYYYSLMENKATNREVFGIYGNQYEEKGNITINIYGNNRIGITPDNSTNKISKSDNEILKEIAFNFKPKLIAIFNKETAYIKNTYKITGYKNEISFEEFFIWWYHFIYTKVTDIMNDKGLLIIPKSGNFVYELEE